MPNTVTFETSENTSTAKFHFENSQDIEVTSVKKPLKGGECDPEEFYRVINNTDFGGSD